jgi:hypothetical protein
MSFSFGDTNLIQEDALASSNADADARHVSGDHRDARFDLGVALRGANKRLLQRGSPIHADRDSN